jgi:hypothetical protein
LLLKVLAVALNVVEVDPVAMIAEVGILSAALLLDNDTVAPPAGAALFKVIVQVLVAVGDKVVGLQASEDTSTGATRLRLAV